jgi:Kef-type K+ transport system membrane component KefB
LQKEIVSLIVLFLIIVAPHAVCFVLRLRSIVPVVVAQIALGILLGPMFLGHFFPRVYDELFPPNVLAQVNGIATLALTLFAFFTGLHLDFSFYRGRARMIGAVAVGSVLCPFLLGTAAAWWIHRTYPQEIGGTALLPFVFSVGIALSVTALPVLGAILREMKLLRTPLGQWALGLAALNDAALWVMMSILLAWAGAISAGGSSPIIALVGGAVFIATMFRFVRPLIAAFVAPRVSDSHMDAVLVASAGFAIISAIVTQLIGLHYLIGAFVAGAVLSGELRHALLDRVETAVVVLLTPFFFVATGLKVQISADSGAFMQILAISTFAAIAGKVAGVLVPAKRAGLSWRDSLALGSLMQCKGMMEIVVLSVLAEAGLIGDQIFSALVFMAMITTAIAMPLTRLWRGGSALARSAEAPSARSADEEVRATGLPGVPVHPVTLD